MITLSTADLREFIRRSSFVKPNMSLSILGYIHLHCIGGIATLTKSNLSASISLTVPAEHDAGIIEVLLEERILSNLCKATNASQIKIEIIAEDVIISDGRTRLSFAKEDVVNFPKRHEWDSEQPSFAIGEDALQSIGVAAKYIALNANLTTSHFSFVHLKKQSEQRHDVFAIAMNNIYLKSFTDPLPDILLSDEACNAISALKGASYQKSGNVDLFKAGDAIYGFTQQGFQTPGYEQLIAGVIGVGGFTIPKESLLRFCELSTLASPSPVPIASWEGGEGEIEEGVKINLLHLKYEDANYRVSNKEDLEVEKDGEILPFNFNTKTVFSALKALPYDTLRICPIKPGMYSLHAPDDEAYTGIIAGVAK